MFRLALRQTEGLIASVVGLLGLELRVWLAWIIARLGGWDCYYKPPGPKTMRAGWARFSAMAAGFALAAQSNV